MLITHQTCKNFLWRICFLFLALWDTFSLYKDNNDNDNNNGKGILIQPYNAKPFINPEINKADTLGL